MAANVTKWKRQAVSRGQRLWNNSSSDKPEEAPTEFDKKVSQLGLRSDEAIRRSRAMQKWAKENRHRRYVPSALLEIWGMEVNEDRCTNLD